MSKLKPPITGTMHLLPFDRLSPLDFERLCLWLIEREGYEHAEYLGAAGRPEQGLDIAAWREGRQWGFQCKRIRYFSPRTALYGLEKVLALPAMERPAGVAFLVTCDVSAKTRDTVGTYCEQHGLACRFYGLSELDQLAKKHPDLLQEFFGPTMRLLPFDRLSPLDFERLCLWLVEREGYEHAEHLGIAGGDQGRDIIAWGEEELWAFQCKRIGSLSSQNALAGLEKVLALPAMERPAGVAFLVTCDVSAKTRDTVGTYCEQHGLALEFWALTGLHERACRYPDLLREFFGWDIADLTQPVPPPTTTIHILPFAQLSLLDLQELCLRLFERNGYRFLQVEPIAVGGTMRRFFAAHTKEAFPETWAFEWLKRDLEDNPSHYLATLEGIRSFVESYPSFAVVCGIQFITPGIIPAPVRSRVRNHCSNVDMKVRFWALTELDQLAKRYPDIVDEYFISGRLDMELEPAGLDNLLTHCKDVSLSPYDKGKALENLSVTLFETCFDVDPAVRTETGEVDLWLECTVTAPFWADYGAIALAECKNRSPDYPVKSAEVSVLIDKCTNADSKLGFFVSLGPFTQDALTKIRDQNVRRGSSDSPLIVPVRFEDVEELEQYKETEDWLRALVRLARQDKKGFYTRGYKHPH